MSAEVRLGRWQSALTGVECDAVITDPPYGSRTHANALGADDGRVAIDYSNWLSADVDEFVASWTPRTRRWIVAMTSHDLIPSWERAFAAADWQTFAPLGIVINGMGVRIQGDGPANWTIHLMVARRRGYLAADGKKIWRSLPGGYTGPASSKMAGGRGKPSWLLDALIRDYTDQGHVVVDPFAGWGSTLVAARNAGRIAVGAEMDPDAHARCQAAIAGDMREFARLAKRPAADADPVRPGLFDALEGGS